MRETTRCASTCSVLTAGMHNSVQMLKRNTGVYKQQRSPKHDSQKSITTISQQAYCMMQNDSKGNFALHFFNRHPDCTLLECCRAVSEVRVRESSSWMTDSFELEPRDGDWLRFLLMIVSSSRIDHLPPCSGEHSRTPGLFPPRVETRVTGF